MPRVIPFLLLLLAGCGFHRPAWDAVTAPALGEARPRPALPAAPQGDADPKDACSLPTTTYHVVAHREGKRSEWLLQLRLACGEEIVGPGESETEAAPEEGDVFLVVRVVTPIDHGTPRTARTRKGSTWWFPMLGGDARAMAVELEQMRGLADAATATATLFAEERHPIGGAIAIINLALALCGDFEIERELLATGQEPSFFDLARAQLLMALRGDAVACEFVTLHPMASAAVVVEEEYGAGTRQRMAFDLTVGSTHVVRITLDTAPVAGPLDLSQGITRVLIQHPREAKTFVVVERLDGAAIVE